jgi:hypothetical protein
MSARSILVGWVLLLGCHAEDDAASSGTPADCPPGQWMGDDGACTSGGLPPDMPCPPGEWQRGTECVPAGVPADGCGEGFAHDGDRGCEPILPEQDCAEGLMAIPGETTCREVAACAAGTWGDIPVEPDTEYVDASYAAGASDGSQTAPWTTIQEGIDAALPGAIVAVAEGSYPESLEVYGKPVRLWGKCPALVDIAGTGFASIDIRIGAGGTEVRRLSIAGQTLGLGLSGSEDVLADEIWIRDNADRGVDVESALGPTGITVRRSLIERAREVGMYFSGSNGTVEDVVVRETLPVPMGLGRGIGIDGAAPGVRVTVTRSLVERNHEIGVYVDGASATLESTVIRNTFPNAPSFVGRGINAQDSGGARASVDVLRSLVERSHEIGVFAEASDVTIEATVVRDTMADPPSVAGNGIVAQDDPITSARAMVAVARSLVERSAQIGVLAAGGDAVVEATVVRDTFANAAGYGGHAIHVQVDPKTFAAGSAVLRTSLFERSVEAAVIVSGPATAEIEACLVRDTVPNDIGSFGDGLLVWSYDGPASAAVTATRIERSARAAVSNFSGTVSLGSSLLLCQSFDIGSEPWMGVSAIFDDRGGVLCGCPDATEPCQAQSYMLQPPQPLE